MTADNRRPIRARSTAWAKQSSAFLVRSGFTPNQISVVSVIFAGLGCVALLTLRNDMGLVLFVVGIQARLLCNLLDGMVAIEGGQQSALGMLYNEFPDRIADSLLFISLGYLTSYPVLGWLSALGAALTAYVRVFGAALGLPQDFRGPMAKQHRMALISVACIATLIEQRVAGSAYLLPFALFIVAVGSLLTCVTRTMAIATLLKEKI